MTRRHHMAWALWLLLAFGVITGCNSGYTAGPSGVEAAGPAHR